jgi:hypothetical protein
MSLLLPNLRLSKNCQAGNSNQEILCIIVSNTQFTSKINQSDSTKHLLRAYNPIVDLDDRGAFIVLNRGICSEKRIKSRLK